MGLSQRALAERLGVAQSTLARWEAGRGGMRLADVDRILGMVGLQLGLGVEPRVDAEDEWRQQAADLQHQTPTQRLAELTPRVLLAQSVMARRTGRSLTWGGRMAAYLQGIPARPRWPTLVTVEDQVDQFARDVGWITHSLVDDHGLDLGVSVHGEWLRTHSRCLARGLGGVVEIVVYAEPPETITVSVVDDGGEPVDVTLVAAGELSWSDRGERPPGD